MNGSSHIIMKMPGEERPAEAPTVYATGRATTSLRRQRVPVVLVGCLVVLSGAVIPLVRDPEPAAVRVAAGDPARQLVYASVYLLVFAMMLPSLWTALGRLAQQAHVVALLALAVVSFSWSVAPDVTLRSATGLIGATLVGAHLGTSYDAAAQLRIVTAVCGSILVGSLLFVIAVPQLGLMPPGTEHHGNWRGVFDNKNLLGQMAALAVLVYVLRILGRSRRWWHLAGLLLAASLLWGSRSVTAFLVGASAAVLLLTLFWLVRTGKERHLFIFAVTCLAFMTIYWVIAHSALILQALGKDPTLTGRTELWKLLVDRVGDRPLGGYGYAASWVTDIQGPQRGIARTLGWTAHHAHNGFLDLAFQLGVPAVAVLVAGMAAGLNRAARFATSRVDAASLWPAVYLVFFVASNITETRMLQPNSLLWTLYVAALCTAGAPRRPQNGHALATMASQLPDRELIRR